MIGYRDTAELAWRQARYEAEFDCMDDYEDYTDEAAREMYTQQLGREFVAEHVEEWMVYIDGLDMETMTEREERYLLRDFCLNDMDEWREFLGM